MILNAYAILSKRSMLNVRFFIIYLDIATSQSISYIIYEYIVLFGMMFCHMSAIYILLCYL